MTVGSRAEWPYHFQGCEQSF